MVLETFILLAGFHEDMQVGFVATITLLFIVKAFHWLIEERINYVRGKLVVSSSSYRDSLLPPSFHTSISVHSVLIMMTLLPFECHFHSCQSISPPPHQMERSPLITWTFHLRAVTLLLFLAAVDLFYVKHSWNSLRTKGASVLIVFGLEVL